MSTTNQSQSEGESKSVSVSHSQSSGESTGHGDVTSHTVTHSVSASRIIEGDSTSPEGGAPESPGGSRQTSTHRTEGCSENSGSSEATNH